jgi:hypothetical protein
MKAPHGGSMYPYSIVGDQRVPNIFERLSIESVDGPFCFGRLQYRVDDLSGQVRRQKVVVIIDHVEAVSAPSARAQKDPIESNGHERAVNARRRHVLVVLLGKRLQYAPGDESSACVVLSFAILLGISWADLAPGC